ncbi:MAG TPA: helix-turn-helix transcriptional regulator [Cyclobacteriaceae bacterium]|nr:helix-turn-helix transcriptional regulator [Cyclobacteriaceae bacterium]
MNFRRIYPPERLMNVIDCYWIAENDDPRPVIQKIIPDGFPEVIFHFGDPFRIRLGNEWEEQVPSLLAGQISSHFFLENSGVASMLGLKFQPTALAALCGIAMDKVTDRVLDLNICTDKLQPLETAIRKVEDFNTRINLVNDHLQALPLKANSEVDKAVHRIFESKGTISVTDLAQEVGVGERSLERLFSKYVGLTPKFYSRVIRFSHIFRSVTSGMNWTQLGIDAGFYDQSHFIKNFKAFTGEDPSLYLFEDHNLANFFLKK